MSKSFQPEQRYYLRRQDGHFVYQSITTQSFAVQINSTCFKLVKYEYHLRNTKK
jgi:hypothetical protein